MNNSAYGALQDADVLLFLVDISSPPYLDDDVKRKIEGLACPKFLILNKMDLVKEDYLEMATSWWEENLPSFELLAISALEKKGVDEKEGHL